LLEDIRNALYQGAVALDEPLRGGDAIHNLGQELDHIEILNVIESANDFFETNYHGYNTYAISGETSDEQRVYLVFQKLSAGYRLLGIVPEWFIGGCDAV
jgi:hypothetical protein